MKPEFHISLKKLFYSNLIDFNPKQITCNQNKLLEYADRLKEYFPDKLIYLKPLDQYNSENDEKKLHRLYVKLRKL